MTQNLLEEFAGMIETDGSFYIGFEKDTSKKGGRKLGYRTRLRIAFNQKPGTMTELLKHFENEFGGKINKGRYEIESIETLAKILPRLLHLLKGERLFDGFWFYEALKLSQQPFKKGPGGGRTLKYYFQFVDIMYNINTIGENRSQPKKYWHSIINEAFGNEMDSTNLIKDIETINKQSFQKFQLTNAIKWDEITLSPYYIVGMVEGDGSLSMVLGIDKNYKFGIRIRPSFSISLLSTEQNYELLTKIKKQLKCGDVSHQGKKAYFKVQSLIEVSQNILPFFDQYSLTPTTKRANQFFFMKKAINLLQTAVTSKDFINIIKLTYDIHEPYNRRTSKNELIEIILQKEKESNN